MKLTSLKARPSCHTFYRLDISTSDTRYVDSHFISITRVPFVIRKFVISLLIGKFVRQLIHSTYIVLFGLHCAKSCQDSSTLTAPTLITKERFMPIWIINPCQVVSCRCHKVTIYSFVY